MDFCPMTGGKNPDLYFPCEEPVILAALHRKFLLHCFHKVQSVVSHIPKLPFYSVSLHSCYTALTWATVSLPELFCRIYFTPLALLFPK